MRKGDNIHLRKDGRYEARYIKQRDEQGRIIYGYCYGHTFQEAASKREALMQTKPAIRGLNLLILGAGSHGQEVMELAQSLRVFQKIDFLDDEKPEVAIGSFRDYSKYLAEYSIAIPAVGNTVARIHWMNQLNMGGFLIPTLIHPSAVISASAKIGNGTVICARATIGPGVKIGQGCIISSGAIINRDVVLPDWSYVECGETVNMNTDTSKLLNVL